MKSSKYQKKTIKKGRQKVLLPPRAATKLKADYRSDWIERTGFDVCDAANNLGKYAFTDGKDFTHIYSYNKLMSEHDS